jgi:predicted cation transporter
MVGGQCFGFFADEVIAVKIDAHRPIRCPVSIVCAAQMAGTGAALRPISSPVSALKIAPNSRDFR